MPMYIVTRGLNLYVCTWFYGARVTRLGEFSLIGYLFTVGSFRKLQKKANFLAPFLQ
jgi:hypothetical protein